MRAMLSSPRFLRLRGLSPWMLLGMALILGAAVTVLSVRSSQRERAAMIHNMVDRAEALIWALEAGGRSGFCRPADNFRSLEPLLMETAKQPGIVFMAVAGNGGLMLAHNDAATLTPEQAAGVLPPPEEVGDRPAWRVRQWGDRKIFEVYRLFAPLQPEHATHPGNGMGRGMGHMRGRSMGPGLGLEPGRNPDAQNAPAIPQERGVWPPPPPGSILLPQVRRTLGLAMVGLDMRPFEATLAADHRNTLVSAALVAALALAAVVSLFWAHNYRRSRRLLRDQRAMAAEVVANLPLGLITSDPAGGVALINATALDMLGLVRDQAVGAPLRGLPGLDWNALAHELTKKGKIPDREARLHLPGRDPTAVSLSAAAVRNETGVFLGHVFAVRDITEVKRLRAEAQRHDRLAALGNLAAGVAHEIRNPLSTIKGVAVYLARRLTPGGREEEAARRMVDEVDRLDRVVSELLQFARPAAMPRSDGDVRAVIRHALRLAEADLQAKSIRVTEDLPPDFPNVPIHAERLTQALLNLFLNAAQAMSSGGTLRVCLTPLPGNALYRITVTDTGPGIAEAALSSIFTPYFTTRPSGTGLGLSIALQIVEGLGGRLHAANVGGTPGQGAEFTLILPLRPNTDANDANMEDADANRSATPVATPHEPPEKEQS